MSSLVSAEVLCQLQSLLRAEGVEAYLVGGLLRDQLLGIHTRDADVVLEGDVQAVARQATSCMGGRLVPLGERHQMFRVVLRRPDGMWQVDFSPLHGTLLDDLARRDFTIDAMALPLEGWGEEDWVGRLVDPHGGRRDLECKMVRMVSELAFQEDPARLLRGPRLAAMLGFALEAQTQEAIARNAHLVTTVPGERVRDEFLAILAMPGARENLGMLDRLGLLTALFPELGAARGVVQPREHYWDVFQHLLETASAAERIIGGDGSDAVAREVPWNDEMARHFSEVVSDGYDRATLLKLAALFHDVAKPETKVVDGSGRTRFLGHPARGATTVRDVLERLRMSGRGIDMACTMVENHMRPTQMSQGDDLPTRRAIYRYFRDVKDVAIDTLYLCLADYLAARGPLLALDDWKRHARIVRHILETGLEETPDRGKKWVVNGHDLMQELGIGPGPFLGEILDAVHEAQAAGEVGSREEALAWASRYIGEKEELGERLAGKDP